MLSSQSSAGELINLISCTQRNDTTNDANEINLDNDDENCNVQTMDYDRNSSTSFTVTATADEPTKSVNNTIIAMTIPNKADGFLARRPSALDLKPIITNTNCDKNVNYSENSATTTATVTVQTPLTASYTKDEKQLNSEPSTQKRINIGFSDVVYTVRKGLCWSRGEFCIKRNNS